MRNRTKFSIFIFSLLASCCGGLFSVDFSNENVREVKAATDYATYFNKTVCNVRVSGSTISATPEVLSSNNKIVDPSYVYVVSIAGSSSSVSACPTINYPDGSSANPVFDVVFSNFTATSGSWSPIFTIENGCLNKTLDVNMYVDGSVSLSAHNWNTVVCRNGGHVNLNLSTTTSGTLHLKDSYNSVPVVDDRGYIDVGIDSNCSCNLISLGNEDISSPDIGLLNNALHSLNSSKNATIGLIRSGVSGHVTNVLTSTDVCAASGYSHDYGSNISYNWQSSSEENPNEYTGCTATAQCLVCNHKRTEKAISINSSRTEPTCTEAGSLTYTATFPTLTSCQQISSIPALGHETSTQWVHDSNYHWKTCSHNNEEQVDKAAHSYGYANYTWSSDYTICTMRRTCNVCGYVYTMESEATLTVQTEPTCTSKGVMKYYASFPGGLSASGTYDIPKLNHTFGSQWNHDETNHWHSCTGLGCSEKADVAAHDYDEPTITWADDASSCHMERECRVCHYIDEEDANSITSTINVNPTCVNVGSRIYTAHFTKITSTYTKEVNDVPALGHDFGTEWYHDETNHWNVCTREGCTEKGNIATHNYGEPEFTWADDGSSCHMARTCLTCGYIEEEDATISSAQNVAPLCLEKGSTLYTAHFTKITDTPTKEVYDLDELGHDFKEEFTYDETHHWHDCNHDCDVKDGYEAHNITSTITKMPSTEEEGIRVYTCTICGYSYSESIEKLPLPPNPEEMTEEEYKEQQKQYEEQQQQVIEQMTEVISDVIEVIDEPDPEAMSEEEYAKEMERYNDKQESAQQMSSALEIINQVNSTDTSEEGATVSQEAKKLAQDNVVQITEASSSEMNSLNEEASNLESALNELLSNPEATEEEIAAVKADIAAVQEKKDTAEIITTQAVVVTAKQTESEEMGSTINNSMPENSDLNMGEVYNDFMQNQISELLGQTNPVEKNHISRKIHRDSIGGGFDYSVPKDVYKQVGDFVDDSVDKMGNAALKIRNCTGEKTVTTIQNYISVIKVTSFKDVEYKQKADEIFAETCYQAILVQMQSEVLASLNANKPDGNNQAAMDQYNEEVAAVSDIEEFEIIVTEVLRQKYLALTGLDDSEVELDDFHDNIYWPIFRAWALNEEVPATIFPDGNVITLEELTKATVNETVQKGANFKWEVNATKGDITFIIIMASLTVVLIGAAIAVPTILKRKED